MGDNQFPELRKGKTGYQNGFPFLIRLILIVGILSGHLSISSVYAAESPVVIVNDGVTLTFLKAPKRVVAMNQAAVEIMLLLGLGHKMVGTAYLDDAILPELSEAYHRIPILARKYPTKEVLLEADPDFVYASFISAFSDKRGLATRRELKKMGIDSYLSPSESTIELQGRDRWEMDLIYKEIQEIGKIFRVENRAETCIADIEAELKKEVIAHENGGREKEPGVNMGQHGEKTGASPKILWLDSFGENGPFVGGGNGAPDEIIALAGGENVFDDLKDEWSTVSREQIVVRDIDIIVLIEATWSTAKLKREMLINDPVYADLPAVKQSRFVKIDFSASMPGIRIPSAVRALKAAIQTF